MKAGRRSVRKTHRSAASGSALSRAVGAEIVRFQEVSNAVDQIAAAILRLDRQDLPCMTLLLFGGPATAQQLAEGLRLPVSAVRDVVARLEMAGYARRSAAAGGPQNRTDAARARVDRSHLGAAAAPWRGDAGGVFATRALDDGARASGRDQRPGAAHRRPSPMARRAGRGAEEPSTRRPVASRLASCAGVRRGEHRSLSPPSRSCRSRRTQRPSLRASVPDLDRRHPARVHRATSNRACAHVDRRHGSTARGNRRRDRLRVSESSHDGFPASHRVHSRGVSSRAARLEVRDALRRKQAHEAQHTADTRRHAAAGSSIVRLLAPRRLTAAC